MSTYKYLMNDALQALAQNRLASALASLRGMAQCVRHTAAQEELLQLSNAYDMLLQYLAQGASDPERERMYCDFVRRAYELATELDRAGELQEGLSFYATTHHTLEKLGAATLNDETLTDEGTDWRTLFDAVWTSAAWRPDDEVRLSDFVQRNDVDVVRRCLVVSAATLSALRFFDMAKLRLLADSALSDHVLIRVRALTGLAMVHALHADRIARYPQEMARLSLMADVPQFAAELEMLQMQFFLTQDTRQIEKSLREEILPEVMKHAKQWRDRHPQGIDGLQEAMVEGDLNPEWEEDGTPSVLGQRMRELADMHRKGADVYMGTFKMLKQRFPFFHTAAHWFCPFTSRHPALAGQALSVRHMQTLLGQAGLCDSDKYSLVLMAQDMPQAMRDMIRQQLSGMGDADTLHPLDATTDELPDFRTAMRSYVQDFYRFSTLFLHREAFENPFSHELFIFDVPPFDVLLRRHDLLARLADFAFADKAYSLALSLFNRLPAEQLQAATFQKMGFCHQQAGHYAEAEACYEKSNLLQPHHTYTLRQRAACLCHTGRFEEALACYAELESAEPEEVRWMLLAADCLMRLERYAEAMPRLHKANYLSEDNPAVHRALAWCCLRTADYGQATRHYDRVLQLAPTPADHLNAGHAAWLDGHVPEAVRHYTAALAAQTAPHPDFLHDDAYWLEAAGKNAYARAMMRDIVCGQQDKEGE